MSQDRQQRNDEQITQKDRKVARMVARQVYELMRYDGEELPPHDRDAEMRVLGSMIVCPEVIPRVAAVITRESFYIERYGSFFDELVRMGDKLCDPEGTIELRKTNAYIELGAFARTVPDAVECANAEYMRIVLAGGSAVFAMEQAQIVADFHFRRRLIRALSILTYKARDSTITVYSLKNMAKGLLEKVSE